MQAILQKLVTTAAVGFLSITSAMAAEDATAMKELASKSGCFSCHDIHKKIVGPAWLDVANRFRDEKGMADVLTQKILNGSKGVWGRIAMPANNVSREEAKHLAHWILSLKQ